MNGKKSKCLVWRILCWKRFKLKQFWADISIGLPTIAFTKIVETTRFREKLKFLCKFYEQRGDSKISVIIIEKPKKIRQIPRKSIRNNFGINLHRVSPNGQTCIYLFQPWTVEGVEKRIHYPPLDRSCPMRWSSHRSNVRKKK